MANVDLVQETTEIKDFSYIPGLKTEIEMLHSSLKSARGCLRLNLNSAKNNPGTEESKVELSIPAANNLLELLMGCDELLKEIVYFHFKTFDQATEIQLLPPVCGEDLYTVEELITNAKQQNYKKTDTPDTIPEFAEYISGILEDALSYALNGFDYNKNKRSDLAISMRLLAIVKILLDEKSSLAA